jgi:hypothetical protein
MRRQGAENRVRVRVSPERKTLEEAKSARQGTFRKTEQGKGDRALIYNLKTGECTGKIFGSAAEIASDSNELLVQKDSRHFVLLDAATMPEKIGVRISAIGHNAAAVATR